MGEDFSGKKWEVNVQTQAEVARSQVVAKLDAATQKELEDWQRILNAISEHGGPKGFTVSKLMEHVPMRRDTVRRHVAALNESRRIEPCGTFRNGACGGLRAGTGPLLSFLRTTARHNRGGKENPLRPFPSLPGRAGRGLYLFPFPFPIYREREWDIQTNQEPRTQDCTGKGLRVIIVMVTNLEGHPRTSEPKGLLWPP